MNKINSTDIESSSHPPESTAAAPDNKERVKVTGDWLASLEQGTRKACEAQINAHVKLKADPGALKPQLRFARGIGALARGEREAPRQVVDGLVIENRIHWLSGHPGHGKSTMAMYVAVEHMAAGGHVIWLDWEAGEVPTVERLMSVGAKVEHVDDDNPDHLFHLAVGSPLSADADGFALIAAALEQYPGALVVFDSASKALGAAGLDENNPTDATKWTTAVVIPTREAGGTVLVIDHVTKGATKSTPYARGAGSKLADTDVSWYVEAVEQFDRSTAGKVELTRKKDREGRLPELLIYKVGDGAGSLPVERVAAEDEHTRDRRDAGLRGRVLAVLEEHSSPERKLSGRQLEALVEGKAADVRGARDELIGMPGSGVEAAPDGRGVGYWYDATKRLTPDLDGGRDEGLNP
jgi:KaiC/GvpD/RAD55 family RecA-like ATPase